MVVVVAAVKLSLLVRAGIYLCAVLWSTQINEQVQCSPNHGQWGALYMRISFGARVQALELSPVIRAWKRPGTIIGDG
jgi:hypothetical protein